MIGHYSEHQLMKQLLHNYLLKSGEPYKRGSGRKLCVNLSKTSVFDNEELCPFNEIATLISGLLKPLILVQGKYGRKNEAECILS